MPVLEHVPPPDPMANAADIPPASSDNPAPGTMLDDRYVIGKELGRGGMGRVFAARDVKLGRDVAIKLVSVGTHDPSQLARLAKDTAVVQTQLAAPDTYADVTQERLQALLERQATLARETQDIEAAWVDLRLASPEAPPVGNSSPESRRQ